MHILCQLQTSSIRAGINNLTVGFKADTYLQSNNSKDEKEKLTRQLAGL